MLPQVIVAVTLALTATATPTKELVPRQGAGCKKIHFIFARGSTETGNMGITVGPALSKALSQKFPGQVQADGVVYPADIADAVTGATNPPGAPGAVKMTAMAKDILSRCPDAKIILGGYSQGAEQVHGALNAKNLGADGAKIAAAVTYGDPMKGLSRLGSIAGWGSLPESRTKVFCNSGDGVCGGSFSISAAHLSYTSNGDIAKGVEFVASVMEQAGQGAAAGSAPAAAVPAPKGMGNAKGMPKGMPKGKGTTPPPSDAPPAL